MLKESNPLTHTQVITTHTIQQIHPHSYRFKKKQCFIFFLGDRGPKYRSTEHEKPPPSTPPDRVAHGGKPVGVLTAVGGFVVGVVGDRRNTGERIRPAWVGPTVRQNPSGSAKKTSTEHPSHVNCLYFDHVFAQGHLSGLVSGHPE